LWNSRDKRFHFTGFISILVVTGDLNSYVFLHLQSQFTFYFSHSLPFEKWSCKSKKWYIL